MLFTTPFLEVRSFLEDVVAQAHLTSTNGTSESLSKKQIRWISVCISSMVLMGMFCFAKIERASAGKFSDRALIWMLHLSKICWDRLFEKSGLRLVRLFGNEGFLVIDDSDRLRSKSASKGSEMINAYNVWTQNDVAQENRIKIVCESRYFFDEMEFTRQKTLQPHSAIFKGQSKFIISEP